MPNVRSAAVGVLALLALVLSLAAAAATPMTLLLDTAGGSGTITLSASTKRLHGAIWLFLANPSAAQGKATVSCRLKQRQGTLGTIGWFRFKIHSDARQEIWRGTKKAPTLCTVSVTLTGHGKLSGSLRGF